MNQGAPLTDSAVDESLQYSVLVVVVGFLFLCFFFFYHFNDCFAGIYVSI